MKRVKNAVAILAVLVMLISLSAGLAGCKEAAQVTIALEATSVTQLTVGAKTVSATSKLADGTKLGAALDSAIADMIQNGELNEEANTVLISVTSQDAALQKTVLDLVSQAFENNSFTGAAICQSADDAAAGKALLIQRMASAYDNYSEDTLAQLSINQLKLLCEADEAAMQGTAFAGTASQAAYVGTDVALDVALTSAETTADAVQDLKVIIDYSTLMFYDVTFQLDGSELEAYIDAVTGELLYSGIVGGERTDDEETGVTEDMALAAACISVGLDATAAENASCEYVDLSSQPYYKVRFIYEGTQYEVLISATTGAPVEGDVGSGSEDLTPEDTIPEENINSDPTIEEGYHPDAGITETEPPVDEISGG